MSPDTPAPAGATDEHDAWVTVLDALERDLTDASTSGSTAPRPATAWTQPTTLGPVPRALVGRASRLLAAQRDRLADLEAERRQTLEHLGALRQVAATDEPRGSVYLDASA